MKKLVFIVLIITATAQKNDQLVLEDIFFSSDFSRIIEFEDGCVKFNPDMPAGWLKYTQKGYSIWVDNPKGKDIKMDITDNSIIIDDPSLSRTYYRNGSKELWNAFWVEKSKKEGWKYVVLTGEELKEKEKELSKSFGVNYTAARLLYENYPNKYNNNLTREAAQEVNKALGLVKGKVLSTNQHRDSFFIVPRLPQWQQNRNLVTLRFKTHANCAIDFEILNPEITIRLGEQFYGTIEICEIDGFTKSDKQTFYGGYPTYCKIISYNLPSKNVPLE